MEPIQYEKETQHPYVMFGGRILNMDVVTESRLLKNIRSHRVPGGICADVTHCQSGLWSFADIAVGFKRIVGKLEGEGYHGK